MAALSDIRIDYAGADGLALDDEGALQIKTAMGVLRDSPPVAWHIDGATRVPVDSRYVLSRDRPWLFIRCRWHGPGRS